MRIKTLFKTTVVLVICAFFATIIAFFFFSLENDCRILSGKKISVQDVERAKRLIAKHDPRKMTAGEKKNVLLNERDLNLLFRYALSRVPGASVVRSRMSLSQKEAELSFTCFLPDNPLGSCLNMSLTVTEGPERPRIKRVRIGEITLTGRWLYLAKPLAYIINQGIRQIPEIAEAAASIQDYEFHNNALHLVYEWQPDLADRIKAKGRELLISTQDRDRLLVYHEELVRFSNTVTEKKISLSRFMKPMFLLAQKRSQSNNRPVLENQAVIVVLALYANGKPLEMLIGEKEGKAPNPPKKVKATLGGRDDLARHYTLSAAIAATTDSHLANAVGLFKEIEDSKGGSGFSFADLAADRAGVGLGELSIGSLKGARRVQERMSLVSGELDFMPPIDRLPEGMMEREFKETYQGPDSMAYKRVKDEIERRISSCLLYRDDA